MSTALPKPWTVEDFLAWEAQQEERYEFIDGMVIMMVGASNAHTIIKGNIFAALHQRLRGKPCRPFVDGPKIITPVDVTFPDVIVTCAPVKLADDRLEEPAVIFEVLSPSTANRDRGGKWVAYQTLPSLKHYVLVGQDRRRMEIYTRANAGWMFQVIEPPQHALALVEIGVEPPLDEIYAGTGL